MPVPAGTTLPSNEKPRTIFVSPEDTSNPASPAAPPDAPSTSTPETANWNPPISDELEYNTSKLESVAAPNEIMLSKQLVSLPPHTPHSSTKASPKQSPEQSTSSI